VPQQVQPALVRRRGVCPARTSRSLVALPVTNDTSPNGSLAAPPPVGALHTPGSRWLMCLRSY